MQELRKTAILLAAMLPVAGCRLGNQVTEMRTGFDTVSGYYQSQLQTLKFSATVGAQSRNVSSTAANLPLVPAYVYTNPVALILDSWDAGEARLSDKTLTYQVGITVDQTTKTMGSSASAESSLPTCTMREDLVKDGSYTPFTSDVVVDNLPTKGRIALTHTYTVTFTGSDCSALMTSFQNCYSDSTQCGGSSQAENDSIHSETRVMFEPFINSGTFTLGELTSVSRLSYQVVYQ